MATNRPYDLDEAMHRRIMIAIEFRQPDHLLRKAIWKSHIPEQMTLKDDIDLVWFCKLAFFLLYEPWYNVEIRMDQRRSDMHSVIHKDKNL